METLSYEELQAQLQPFPQASASTQSPLWRMVTTNKTAPDNVTLVQFPSAGEVSISYGYIGAAPSSAAIYAKGHAAVPLQVGSQKLTVNALDILACKVGQAEQTAVFLAYEYV